ncbi:Amino acid transporter, transmembrane domain [Dillenia turbinata]|uniref:Amino acid transporter, transmembrane domain n=1 Tax=Dillenia turbinata TaxID=194707 RepID=A0AAN8WI80_9MAGN
MGFVEEASSSTQRLNPPPKPTEESPLLSNSKLSSNSKTFANVLIAIVGAGVLGLPYTFKRTGWVMGLLMLWAISALTYHCMMLLVYTRRKLESVLGFVEIGSFGDLGAIVCGPIGRIAVDFMIVFAQSGFCVGYLIFTANTLVNLLNSPVSGDDLVGLLWGFKPRTMYIWGCLPFQIGLNSIRTLTHMAPLSIFADIVDVGAMGVVVVKDVIIIAEQRPVAKAFGDLSALLYCVGVAIYCFEGVGMVLPLESETKDKKKYGKVVFLTMLSIAFTYGAFGVLCYFAFGERTKEIVTANFGPGVINTLVQLGLCINLFMTFPLMMNPVYEIVERYFTGGRFCLWLRWLMVLLVCLVAISVPNFTDFLSLVGSSICCLLGFVLPSLFHLLVFKEEVGWKGVSSDIVIMILGIVFAISGTWYSLTEMFSDKV